MEPVDGLALHRPQPGGQEQRLHRHRRLGHGHDPRHHRRHPADRPDPGRANPWARLYDPSRKPLKAARRSSLKENVNVAPSSTPTGLAGGEVSLRGRDPAGQGAVVRRGLTSSRSTATTEVHAPRRSAVCPHLGCIVHWNSPRRPGTAPATARASARRPGAERTGRGGARVSGTGGRVGGMRSGAAPLERPGLIAERDPAVERPALTVERVPQPGAVRA